MDFFRIVGYTEGFRSYRIGLLAVLALCRKLMNLSWQIINANPIKWDSHFRAQDFIRKRPSPYMPTQGELANPIPNLDIFSGIRTPPQKWQINHGVRRITTITKQNITTITEKTFWYWRLVPPRFCASCLAPPCCL
jgi:hypothetical protein